MPRQFDVVIERDSEGYYIASVPQLPACHTQARSLDEVTERIRELSPFALKSRAHRYRGWSLSAFSASPSPHEPYSSHHVR